MLGLQDLLNHYSITTGQITVTTSAQAIGSGDCKLLFIKASGSNVYIGDEDVTAANGYWLGLQADPTVFGIDKVERVYCRASTGSATLYWMGLY